MANVLDAFPKRALKPVTAPGYARKRILGLFITVLLVLPSLYLFNKVASEASLRRDLRARGVEAEILDSDGRCTSRRQITGDNPLGCNLEISYRTEKDHGGETLTADVWLDGSAPIFTPPAVYDPQDPSRVMLKPEVERDAEPDEFILALVLLALPAAGLLLWFATGQGRLAKAARQPRPMLVRIERVVGQQNWAEYWVRPDGAGDDVRALLPISQKPFLVQPPGGAAEGAWALALRDHKGRPLMMDEGLSSLDFTSEERQVLRAAASA